MVAALADELFLLLTGELLYGYFPPQGIALVVKLLQMDESDGPAALWRGVLGPSSGFAGIVRLQPLRRVGGPAGVVGTIGTAEDVDEVVLFHYSAGVKIVTFFITTGSMGRSRISVGVLPIFFTTSMPLTT